MLCKLPEGFAVMDIDFSERSSFESILVVHLSANCGSELFK